MNGIPLQRRGRGEGKKMEAGLWDRVAIFLLEQDFPCWNCLNYRPHLWVVEQRLALPAGYSHQAISKFGRCRRLPWRLFCHREKIECRH